MINETYGGLTELSGKSVFVTGGTTGIGRAIAMLLSSKGCRTFICGRNSQNLEATIAALNAQGAAADGVAVDLETCDGVRTAFAAADGFLGRLDFCVANAALPAGGDLLTREIDYWKKIVDVNLAATISVSIEACARMVKQGGGHVVMIGSMSAGTTDAGSSVYSATKAGVRGFAAALRKEMNSRGVRVSLLEPGSAATEMVDETPAEREKLIAEEKMLRAEDIAEAVHFVLTRPHRCDVIEMQLRPHMQLI